MTAIRREGGTRMESTIASLPGYLKTYVVTQDPNRYSARDHAAWRYIMRQSRAYFKDHAVSIYLAGLEQTGITIDRIPLISEMDAKLKRFGWGAVPVCGFIPPAAFLDFQARRILPIAFDMRSVHHIAYTPAPDIVHEAAGHAPIIADENYANYLTMYASMAQKAIFSRQDLDLYEAIRTLSDVKENPDSTSEMIAAAEAALTRASDALTYTSEANKVARMNWWTVEYGLLGSLQNPKIYGAGLLSSVGESQACLSSKVKKLPLSLKCVETTYNITEPQPQLFVAEDISHLVSILKEFETTLSFRRGGLHGLSQAKKCQTVTTTVLDSGIQISGELGDYLTAGDDVIFIRFVSPVQLSYNGQELPNQGTAQHPHGFSSPLGRLTSAHDRPLTNLDDATLAAAGLKVGSRTRLSFTTGFVVEGLLSQVLRKNGQIILMTWKETTVTRGSEVYFEPAWGDFDMAVGEKVVSVFGGPADRERYDLEFGHASTSPARTSPYSAQEHAMFDAYSTVRKMRDTAKKDGVGTLTLEKSIDLAETYAKKFPNEWLLTLEVLELATMAKEVQGSPSLSKRLENIHRYLTEQGATHGPTHEWLIRQGLALVSQAD